MCFWDVPNQGNFVEVDMAGHTLRDTRETVTAEGGCIALYTVYAVLCIRCIAVYAVYDAGEPGQGDSEV